MLCAYSHTAPPLPPSDWVCTGSPFLAYGQHKIFKKPFLPKPREKDWDGASLVEPEPGLRMSQVKETPRTSRMALLKSRFSLA